ncbi:beta-1,3-galactosyltransferase 1-like [Mercenaria mercenaria]|uniref:beta-1,3-galactosyltransferase 1-like n=1 Tax=Mercenaria mercenaria TaxID=6596 RepID=UPI00234F2BD3|nr:beta-1,3-galactosyltransferase 1-like [Mercenaria mercenaria]XP_045210109.2 beta-1,3-galactosyltransferase 1-like [Mercenaria mercenaria]XP_045210110.2 beta-1,3-galactosyltransferase 1-like [Mercenaria mercenaria]
MNPLHAKGSKYSCGKISVKMIVLSFLGLILYVGCNLLLSTSKMSVIVDMSIKMRSNVVDVLNSIADLSSAHSINGTIALKSFPRYENERDQKEQSVYFQFTDDKTKSFFANSSTDTKLRRNGLQAGNGKENDVRNDLVNEHSRLPSKSQQTTLTKHSIDAIHFLNKTYQKQEGSSLVKEEVVDNSTVKKEIVDKFGNSVNTNVNRRQYNCSSCFLHNFNYVIQNERICEQYSPNQTIDLIVLIMTTHKNIRARTALRSTWLSHTKNNTANVRYAFLLGETSDYRYKESVLQENSVYHDIIKEDFVDTYMNLTYKTIMGFKWAATKCMHASYVMKTDDDMFVNIPNVLKIFKGPNIEILQTTVVGACNAKARPIRNRKSKWFASEDSYPEKFYPGFCSGTGYVTSMHVANEVYKISPSVPFFHLEDVYVSLCIKVLGFKLQAMPGFNAGRPKMDPCLYKGEKLITAHQLTPVMLQLVWFRQCPKNLI